MCSRKSDCEKYSLGAFILTKLGLETPPPSFQYVSHGIHGQTYKNNLLVMVANNQKVPEKLIPVTFTEILTPQWPDRRIKISKCAGPCFQRQPYKLL